VKFFTFPFNSCGVLHTRLSACFKLPKSAKQAYGPSTRYYFTFFALFIYALVANVDYYYHNLERREPNFVQRFSQKKMSHKASSVCAAVPWKARSSRSLKAGCGAQTTAAYIGLKDKSKEEISDQSASICSEPRKWDSTQALAVHRVFIVVFP